MTNGTVVVNYEYYANGWLKNVKKVNDLIAAYIYDNVGNRTKLTYGNDSYQEFAYEETDPRYQLEGIDYAYKCNINSSIANHGGLDFTRDNSGNPLTWGSDEYTKSYTYDDNSRLESANYPGHPTESWSYDWVGNRLGTGYSYNAADQLTASPGKTYGYDYAGNLTSITGTGANKVFTYTYDNLVSEIEHNGSSTSSMVWDSSGNRVSFTSSTGGTYNYVYDITAGIPAVIEEITPGGSIYYVREPSGALIARISGGLQEGKTIQYYHFDELGSTLFMTDSDAVVTDRYTYDAWGNVTSHRGNTNQPYQYVGELGYFTHYQDINLPYIQTGVRLYNPEIGRYMQEDPIGDGLNWYGYVDFNPIQLIDPFGQVPLGKWILIDGHWFRFDVGGDLHWGIKIGRRLCSEGSLFWDTGVLKHGTKPSKEIIDIMIKRRLVYSDIPRDMIGIEKPKVETGCTYDTVTTCIMADPKEFKNILTGDPEDPVVIKKPNKKMSWWDKIKHWVGL